MENSKSTIVARMDNYYEENPDLPIDPCHDSFINRMEDLGFELDTDVVLPEGRQIFQFWSASCQYESENFSALVESATSPYMKPGETIETEDRFRGDSRLTMIAGRPTIIRPPSELGVNCSVAMSTNFGSMRVYGSSHRTPNPEADCARIVALLETIEPWIND